MNKHRMMQYIGIAFVLTVAAGSFLYFRGSAATKINSSKVNNLTSGLVGYWTFDGADTSWSGDNATLTNKGTLGVSANGTSSGMSQSTSPAVGKIGQSFTFDGNDDYVAVTNLGVTTGDWTLSFWAKLSTISPPMQYPISRNPQSRGIFMAMNGSDYKWGAYDGTNFVLSNTPTNTTGNWYHLTVTRSGSSYTLYLNGNNDGSGNLTDGFSPTQLWFGNGDWPFNGSLDEIRFYNRVISQSEITELYQQGQTKINASQTNKLTSGLVGYWPFDGNYINWSDGSAEIKDASGYNGCGGSPCHADALSISQSTGVKIGKIGQALDFNATTGANDRIDLGASNAITVSNSFTVSMWIFTSGGSDDYGTLVAKDGNGPGIWYRGAAAGANQNKLTYYYAADHHSNALSTGAWHHVVARNNAGTFNFYIDGVIDPNTYTGAPGITSLRYIGEDDSSEDFKGQIDEVRIYNRALTQSEITELYQQGQTKINASQAGKSTNGLVGHWTMDGNNVNWADTSSEIKDVSGNGYHGDAANIASSKARIGKVGQGLYLDQSGDSISIGDISALDGQSYLTLSAWVKLNALRPYGGIFSKLHTDTSGFLMGLDNDTYPYAVWVGVNNSSIPYILTNTLSMTNEVGNWHLWTMVFDGTQTGNANRLKFYFDGVQKSLDFLGETVPATTLAGNSGSFYIGNTGTSPNATIDEARAYNRALSQSEVTELYNLGR